MALTTYNCTALTGGAARALDLLSVSALADGDRALCAVGGEVLYFMFDADGTDAENVAAHPYKVRPNDYATAGVWIEQVGAVVTNGVAAAANLTDNALARGDGGAKGVQTSTVLVDDSGRMTNPSQPSVMANITTRQSDVTGNGTAYTITGEIWTEIISSPDFLNGTFIAPITGLYQISGVLSFDGVLSTHTYGFAVLKTSNRNYTFLNGNPGAMQGASALNIPFSCTVDMDTNDTAYLETYFYYGTKVIDITPSTYLMASLLR